MFYKLTAFLLYANMFLVCTTICVCVVLSTRVFPQYVFGGRRVGKLSAEQTGRLWEEVVSFIWYCCNSVYVLNKYITYDFFFHDMLKRETADPESAQYADVRLYLAANMSFYVGLLIVSLWHPRRRDYKEMAAHHVITLLLMYSAYSVGFYDISIFVLFVNAISDIFLSGSKIAYDLDSKWQTPLFACFVLAHLVLRVIFYPYKAWRSYYYSIDAFTHNIAHVPGLSTVPLWLLYLFWTPKIFKVCWRRLVNGVRQVDKSVRQKNKR